MGRERVWVFQGVPDIERSEMSPREPVGGEMKGYEVPLVCTILLCQ